MRVFFGVTLPEPTKREIIEVQRSIRTTISDARLEGPDKLHITLLFIGDFETGKVDSLFNSAEGELKDGPRTSPLTEIVGMKFFPNLHVRRGIWLDCRDDGTLAAFADSVKTAARQYGVVPEAREFRAHITIARLHRTSDSRDRPARDTGRFGRDTRPGDGDLQKLVADGKLSVKRFFPRSVALFESTLKPSGSEYKILHEYPLEIAEDSA